MSSEALSLDIRRIVTDSDLDGVVTGAILRRCGPMPKSYSDILANYEQGCWMTVWTGILQYVICPGILSVD